MTMAEQLLATGPETTVARVPDVFAGPAGRAFRQLLLSDEIIGQVLSEVGPDGLRLTGDGGFLPQLVKAVLERGLAAELSDHLGYGKGDPAGRNGGNSRNGTTPKTLQTEVGPVVLDAPRDRAGTFAPALVPKGVTRVGGGLDDSAHPKIIR